MQSVLGDIRYGIRSLLHNPGFTAVAVLSLALGIGANTTIFSVANALLYRPLPFHDPDRLVLIHEQNKQQESVQRRATVSTLREWRERGRSFERIEGIVWFVEGETLSGEGPAEWVSKGYVTPGAFALLGVQPFLGHEFTPEESVPGNRAVMIGHGLWQRRYGGDPDAVGRTLHYAGIPGTIVGVMPPGFWTAPFSQGVDLWVPVDFQINELSPDTRWMMAYGRLKPEVTIEQAQAEMEGFAQHMAEQNPETYKDWTLRIEPLQENYVRGSETTLYMLLGAVGFILLIACANVANLLLARASRRQKEVAIRASLGAGRWRLLRQLLTESLLLGLAGGVLGVAVGFAGLRLFVALAPARFGLADQASIDGNVLLFTVGISVLTGILFGLAPALRATSLDLVGTLKEGHKSSGGPRQRSSRVLAVCEVALAFVLLIGAGLMISSVSRLKEVDVGYNPENLLAGTVTLASPKYREWLPNDLKRVTQQTPLFYERVVEDLGALPGVRSATAVSVTYSPFRIMGRPAPPPDQQAGATVHEVEPGYFQTLGVPLRRGRLIGETDREGSPWVAVVNETMAQRFFPDEDPLGQLVLLTFGAGAGVGKEDQQPRRIIGVVADVKHWSPAQTPQPTIYTSDQQHQWVYPSGGASLHLQKTLLVRTAADPMSLAAPLREVVAAVDSDQTVHGIAAQTDRLEEQIGPWRFFQNLYATFAGLALALAVVGVYGVLSHSVAERRHEFGIRMALGAEKRNVLRLVLRQGLVLGLIGVAIGALASFGLTRFLGNLLFEVQPQDPLTFAAVSGGMLLVALAACYLPARRATAVDPVRALRHE
jgi:putative ABC transport system permease protein